VGRSERYAGDSADGRCNFGRAGTVAAWLARVHASTSGRSTSSGKPGNGKPMALPNIFKLDNAANVSALNEPCMIHLSSSLTARFSELASAQ